MSQKQEKKCFKFVRMCEKKSESICDAWYIYQPLTHFSHQLYVKGFAVLSQEAMQEKSYKEHQRESLSLLIVLI